MTTKQKLIAFKLLSPFFLAIFVFAVERALLDPQWLTKQYSLHHAVLDWTAIGGAYRHTGDVGYLYYFAYLCSIPAIYVSATIVLWSSMYDIDAFARLALRPKPIIITFICFLALLAFMLFLPTAYEGMFQTLGIKRAIVFPPSQFGVFSYAFFFYVIWFFTFGFIVAPIKLAVRRWNHQP